MVYSLRAKAHASSDVIRRSHDIEGVLPRASLDVDLVPLMKRHSNG